MLDSVRTIWNYSKSTTVANMPVKISIRNGMAFLVGNTIREKCETSPLALVLCDCDRVRSYCDRVPVRQRWDRFRLPARMPFGQPSRISDQ